MLHSPTAIIRPKAITALLLAILLACASLLAPLGVGAANSGSEHAREIVVKPRKGQDIRALAARSNATVVAQLPESDAWLLRSNNVAAAQTTLGRMRQDGVDYAEPNTVLKVAQDDYPVAEQDDYPVTEQDD